MSNIFGKVKNDPKPPWDIKETSITDKIFGFITSGACNKQKYNFCSNTLHKRIIIAVSLLLICLFFIFMPIGLHEIRMNKPNPKRFLFASIIPGLFTMYLVGRKLLIKHELQR